MSDSLTALRHELPALALTVGFAKPTERSMLADYLLFWLELRRALLASESMLAATRIAWWRDALEQKRGEAPLAQRLIAKSECAALASALATLIESIIQPEIEPPEIKPNTTIHTIIGERLGDIIDKPTATLVPVLVRLDNALLGNKTFGKETLEKETPPSKIGHPVPDLINWCCDKPSRLAYPDRHPMLALAMLAKSITL